MKTIRISDEKTERRKPVEAIWNYSKPGVIVREKVLGTISKKPLKTIRNIRELSETIRTHSKRLEAHFAKLKSIRKHQKPLESNTKD